MRVVETRGESAPTDEWVEEEGRPVSTASGLLSDDTGAMVTQRQYIE